MNQKIILNIGIRWSLLLLALALLCMPLATDAAPNSLALHRAFLTIRPGWTISGAFTPDGNLVLVDALYSKVYESTRDGQFVREIQSPPPSSKFAFSKPSIINAIPGGYLLESEHGSFIRFDTNFKPIDAVDVLTESRGSKYAIGGIYDWTPLGNGETILAFGDIRTVNQEWFSGFLRLPLKNPANFEILYRIELTDPARNFYLLGNHYIAAIGDRGYFVLMNKAPSIYEALPNSSQPRPLLASLTTRLAGDRPELPEKKGFESARALYASLERAKNFVSGLYAADGALYLLKRTPSKDGTTWLMSRIDPAPPGTSLSDKVVYSRSLSPISTSHLSVIPDPREWAFVEKGPVTGLLEQRIASVAFVPSDEIEKP